MYLLLISKCDRMRKLTLNERCFYLLLFRFCVCTHIEGKKEEEQKQNNKLLKPTKFLFFADGQFNSDSIVLFIFFFCRLFHVSFYVNRFPSIIDNFEHSDFVEWWGTDDGQGLYLISETHTLFVWIENKKLP